MKTFAPLCATLLVLSTAPALAQQGPPVAAPQLQSLAPLVEAVKAAVVNVDVQKRVADDQQELMDRFLRGGRRPRGEDAPLSAGTGSGFIIDPKGVLLTNNHVVENAVNIRVRLDDGRSFEGETVGRDPLTDVAVVRLKGKFEPLPSVKLGESGTLRPGDWVVAIGNPFGLAQSVSAGIISALDRQIGASRFDQFLQTDAAINPGNSGGPLFNLKGEVVGMNTAIIGAATGIGFAVPSNLIKAIVPQLQKQGVVTRGYLGVGIQDVTPALGKYLQVSEGALVTAVTENSPAQKAGLKEEDVITMVDGEKIASSTALTRLVALRQPDTVVAMSGVRAGKPFEAKVKLGLRPDLENLGELDKKKTGESPDTHKRLGLSFQDIDPRMAEAEGVGRKGALVVEVAPGSAAEQAGLHPGMIIVEVNHRPIANRDELQAALKGLKSGAIAALKVTVPRSDAKSLIALEVP